MKLAKAIQKQAATAERAAFATNDRRARRTDAEFGAGLSHPQAETIKKNKKRRRRKNELLDQSDVQAR